VVLPTGFYSGPDCSVVSRINPVDEVR